MSIELPRWLSDKESAKAGNAVNMSLIPGSGRSPGGGNGNPHQYSCLENPMERGAWGAPVHEMQTVGHDLALLSTDAHRILWKHTHTHTQMDIKAKSGSQTLKES